MAETLGSLIDKLTIANLRLWHLEDARRDRSLSDRERLAAADAISVVNKQRNDLMDEIDEFLYKAAHGRVKLTVPKVKIYKKFQLTAQEEATSDRLARGGVERKPPSRGGRAKPGAGKPAKAGTAGRSGGRKKD